MEDLSYIKEFYITKYNFKNIYSAAPVNVFNMPCIGYVLKGKGRFHYKGKIFEAKENDLIYISKGTRYYSVWSGEPDIEFYSVRYNFNNPYDKIEYDFQILKNYPIYNLEKIYNTYKKNPMESIGNFYIFLDMLYPALSKKVKTKEADSLKPAIDYIENHFTDKINIEKLSELCNYSQSRFFSLFKNTTGCTPIEYKNNLLIQSSVELLKQTDKTIEEISNILMFSSSAYFRKTFKKFTGKTPKEFRKN